MFLVQTEIKIFTYSQFIGFSQEAMEDSSQLATLTQRDQYICMTQRPHMTARLNVATTDKDQVEIPLRRLQIGLIFALTPLST